MPVQCVECGGTNVQAVYWCDPNEDKILEDFGSWDETDTKWCNDCDAHVMLEEVPDESMVKEDRRNEWQRERTEEDMGLRETQIARHRKARRTPLQGYEQALVNMLEGWKEYAEAHEGESGCSIENDNYAVEMWGAIGHAIKLLLSCEHGALDGGEMCKEINETAKEWGIHDLEKYW